jgi:hypothetical protein
MDGLEKWFLVSGNIRFLGAWIFKDWPQFPGPRVLIVSPDKPYREKKCQTTGK